MTNDGQPSPAPRAQPTTPLKSVEESKKLTRNVCKMPPQARQHPKAQADHDLAKEVMAEDAAR